MHKHFGARQGLSDDAFDEIVFLDLDDLGEDVPWSIRYDSWAEDLNSHPFEWRILYDGTYRKQAETICRAMRRRGCLSVIRKKAKGAIMVLAAVWRFEDEGA